MKDKLANIKFISKIKILNYIFLIFVTIVSLILIFLLDMKLGKDYSNYFMARAHFEQPADFDKVKNICNDKISSIEGFERKSDADINVFFVDALNDEQRNDLEDGLKTLPGFLSVEYVKINTITPNVSKSFIFISLFILLLAFYIASLNIRKPNIRFGLILSFVGITFLEFSFMYAILTVISNFVYINKVLVELFLALFLTVVFINILILWKLSQGIKELTSPKAIISSIVKFDIVNDQDFVFWYFLIVILFMGVVVNLHNLNFILLFVYLVLIYQMYLISSVWTILFDIWLFFLKNFPVVKDLKWSQMK